MNWVAIHTTPQHRVEFTVLHRATQLEYPALLPYEIVWEKRPGKKLPVERKYALFPRYVFIGMHNITSDYGYLKSKIPEIHGIVCRSRDHWSPLIISPADVERIAKRVEDTSATTEVNLHKAFKAGQRVEVFVGGAAQTTKIDAVTKKGFKVMLEMFQTMHIVEVPFASVRAA